MTKNTWITSYGVWWQWLVVGVVVVIGVRGGHSPLRVRTNAHEGRKPPPPPETQPSPHVFPTLLEIDAS